MSLLVDWDNYYRYPDMKKTKEKFQFFDGFILMPELGGLGAAISGSISVTVQI
jgi:hypothetical protein